MPPADERFEPGHLVGGERDDWLVEQEELAALERAGEVGLEPQLGLSGLERGEIEHLAAAAAEQPRAVHRRAASRTRRRRVA